MTIQCKSKKVRFNNNRNRVFFISDQATRVKIETYIMEKDCLRLYNIAYFNKGDDINFAGNTPVLYKQLPGWNNAPGIWKSLVVYNQWKLYSAGKKNEWHLYNQGLLAN